ncbi:MAG: hypothetical protein ACUVYA_03390 [Planctomycetota bacterium]
MPRFPELRRVPRPIARGSLVLAAAWAAAACLWVLLPRAGRSEGEAVAPEVLQALRKFLSSDPSEEASGEQSIRLLGPRALPQIRAWASKVRHDLDRVSKLLERLEGTSSSGAPPSRRTVDEFLSQKLAECRQLVREGRYPDALALAEAAAILDRSGPYAWEFRRLARRAKEREVAAQKLEPAVDSSKLVYEIGERPRLSFRLENHDAKVARIRLDRGAIGEISSTVTRRWMDGSMKREETRLPVRIDSDVDQVLIGPGQTWERELGLDLDEGGLAGDCVARVQIAGRFRPARWTIERERDENIAISMNPLEFWIVPAGETDLCEKPLEKMVSALFFRKLRSFFVGGQIAVWVGEEDADFNEAVVRSLVTGLDDMDPETSKVAVRLLREATGFDFGEDRGRWKAWWGGVLEGKSAKRP